MKVFSKILLFLLLPGCMLLLSLNKNSLLDHPMPLLSARAMDGKVIDGDYYKGHVTIVSFMYIGCIPCMDEISTLNRLRKEYSGDERCRILCIARQMGSQMADFNSSDKNLMSSIRKAIGAEAIGYDIQPACPETASKMERSTVNDSDEHISIKSECNVIEETYGVHSYPTLFFVDRNGIIKNIHIGGPPMRNDTAFYRKIKKELDFLLAE